MRTRDEVLREFSRPYQSHEDVGGPDADRMADEIVRLREKLAASEPVAWAVFSEKGHLQYVTLSENEAEADESLGRKRTPLYAHPSAAAVCVTDAQVEAVAKALRQRDEGTAWCTWDTIKPQTRALYMDEARKILTAASEGASDA